jgi:hypothetical protein
MEANELSCKDLMVGDWVRIKITQHNTEVTNIDANSIYTEAAFPIRYDEIEPIPLTSEILEKNGFVANKHVYPYPYYEYTNKEDKLKIGFAFPQGNKTSYKEPWVCIDSENVLIVHLPCIYVHQLQHALRLCGIEKEIVL